MSNIKIIPKLKTREINVDYIYFYKTKKSRVTRELFIYDKINGKNQLKIFLLLFLLFVKGY